MLPPSRRLSPVACRLICRLSPVACRLICPLSPVACRLSTELVAALQEANDARNAALAADLARRGIAHLAEGAALLIGAGKEQGQAQDVGAEAFDILIRRHYI